MQEFSKNLQGDSSARGRQAPGSILIKSDINEFSDSLKNMNMSDRARKYKDQPGGGDYLKQIISQGTHMFRGVTAVPSSRSSQGGGPSFGQSRIGYSGAQSSGGKSNTSMGTGLASRFSLALSRVIDSTATTTGANQ